MEDVFFAIGSPPYYKQQIIKRGNKRRKDEGKINNCSKDHQ